MTPDKESQWSLTRRFNQLKLDSRVIAEVAEEITLLQQRKYKLENKFYLCKASYEADHRAFYESTHDTIIPPGRKSSPESRFEQALRDLLKEAIEEKKCEG